MAKEYIERDRAVGKFIERKYCSTASKIDYGEVIRLLNSEPTADVQEVRHGKWIEYDNGVQTCSECGEEHEWQDYRASYCEDCGAKMDKT